MSEPERYLPDTSSVIDLLSPAQITSDAEYLISSITVAAGRNPRSRWIDLLVASIAAHHPPGVADPQLRRLC